ncbi:MAG: cyclic nucleotide-binding domain-containing protein [Planctomycetota bacterium]|jgi:CRP-like cAMP-binding protein
MGQKKVHLERIYGDGEVIVAEGDPGSDMFIIQEGAVSVEREVSGQRVTLATLQRGEFFGEMSLLENLPRIATARAVGRTKLLVLKRGGLLLKLRRDPTFALEMLQQMSRRLRLVDEGITSLLAAQDFSSGKLESILREAGLKARGEAAE